MTMGRGGKTFSRVITTDLVYLVKKQKRTRAARTVKPDLEES